MKKRRKPLNLVKGSHSDEQPLNTYPFIYPTPESFDGNKIDRFILDEPAMWQEVNPNDKVYKGLPTHDRKAMFDIFNREIKFDKKDKQSPL